MLSILSVYLLIPKKTATLTFVLSIKNSDDSDDSVKDKSNQSAELEETHEKCLFTRTEEGSVRSEPYGEYSYEYHVDNIFR